MMYVSFGVWYFMSGWRVVAYVECAIRATQESATIRTEEMAQDRRYL